MPQKVRVGLVSTSWWAEEMYLPALQSHAGAEITAICGRDQVRAGTIAGKYGVGSVFSDYRRMIKEAGLDAVIIAAPDDLHYAVTLDALEAGLHVLCEKPLASNAKQALTMAEKAAAVGVKHMVLYTLRWIPQFQYLRDLIGEGYIGRPYHCEFRYLFGYARSKAYMWRLDRRRANGLLGDIGSHLIDMARWLMGEFGSVTARLGTFVERPGAEGGAIDPANDCAFLLAQFANGACGVLQASGVAHLAERVPTLQIRLYGEGGAIELDVPPFGPGEEGIIRGSRSDEQRYQVLEVPASYWGAADPAQPMSVFTKNSAGARLFIDAILRNDPIAPDFFAGYRAQQVIDAAIESHASGCAVEIRG